MARKGPAEFYIKTIFTLLEYLTFMSIFAEEMDFIAPESASQNYVLMQMKEVVTFRKFFNEIRKGEIKKRN